MTNASARSLAGPTSFDDPLLPIRDLPQFSRLRIPPLRDPVPARSLGAPSPLEPNAVREFNGPKAGLSNGSNPPTELPTLGDLLNATRTRPLTQPTPEKPSNPEPPPKTILPAFISLRAVENLPCSPFDEELPRKCRRIERHGDGFGEHLQLPIPKVRKNSPKPPPFGPLTILNGLNEPPPNAALFPPIEPDGAPTILSRPTRDSPVQSEQVVYEPSEERRGRISEIIDTNVDTNFYSNTDANVDEGDDLRSEDVREESPAKNHEADSECQPEVAGIQKEKSNQPKEKSRKKLRKWTEQETTHLLRGVVRCGVGNWTTILAQSDLEFNGRTPGNLKDRFRVCCPWAYGPDPRSNEVIQTSLAQAVSGSEFMAGKILLPDPRHVKSNADSKNRAAGHAAKANTRIGFLSSSETASRNLSDNNSDATGKTSKDGNKGPTFKSSESLSSKSMSTLESLGISEPQTSLKSSRRGRRPFTPAEDEALLKGYAVHGFQWTLIRQDEHLDLMHRKATDLRDRFRTKFPNAYREGGSATAKNIRDDDNKGSETISNTNNTTCDESNSQSRAQRSGEGRQKAGNT